ncbi:uncharacterized protein A4U43_C05F11740 [Asparagus officinalis]|uniref:Uncharacterized protein n=1 Tax=Asparagus officinalis TaxID=4686 RepID=A0A5P1ER25_ASPOF|nr:uncharacterized protein A4U43_C05F11740 [Asparagus officinalis]
MNAKMERWKMSSLLLSASKPPRWKMTRAREDRGPNAQEMLGLGSLESQILLILPQEFHECQDGEVENVQPSPVSQQAPEVEDDKSKRRSRTERPRNAWARFS